MTMTGVVVCPECGHAVRRFNGLFLCADDCLFTETPAPATEK
jgi:hypothetical protein